MEENFLAEQRPNRCVLIMNEKIKGGYLANAIAVIALTVGQRHPYLVGNPLVDASGEEHPGLIPIGIPMLQCGAEELAQLRTKALAKGCDIVDFPLQGQQTKNYAEFTEMMTTVTAEEIEYLGIAIVGQKNAVNKITRHCSMIS